MKNSTSRNKGKVLLISFSGLDGAGKSTQISLLKNYFERCGKRWCVVTMYDDVSIARRIRSIFKPKHNNNSTVQQSEVVEGAVYRMDKNCFSWRRFILRMVVYLLDVVHLWCVVMRKSFICDVIIFDRYIYDSLVNLLTYVSNRWMWWYVRFVVSISPRMDLSVFLSTLPETAFDRKKEYDFDYMKLRYRAYTDFFERCVPVAVWVDGTIEEIHEKLKGALDAKE